MARMREASNNTAPGTRAVAAKLTDSTCLLGDHQPMGEHGPIPQGTTACRSGIIAVITRPAVATARQAVDRALTEEGRKQEQRVNDHRARLKSAELLSATGALVLGIGLGAALSTYIGSAAVLLLVAGIASHGWGMLQKHRLEAKADYAPASWETALCWVCWAALAVLLVLIGVKALTG